MNELNGDLPPVTGLAAKGAAVLIACEESQTVCKAFREVGIEAYSCDLQDCRGEHPEWHIKADALGEAYSGKYIAMIAHPPCTFMSKAGARWLFGGGKINEERLNEGYKARVFFHALMEAPIKYIAIENPTPLKIFKLPKESQVIQPYQFGHEFSKRTLLWLKGFPNLIPTYVKENFKPYLPSNTGGKKRGQKYQFKNITQKESSKTFEGIAKAMAEQWGVGVLNGSPLIECSGHVWQKIGFGLHKNMFKCRLCGKAIWR